MLRYFIREVSYYYITKSDEVDDECCSDIEDNQCEDDGH